MAPSWQHYFLGSRRLPWPWLDGKRHCSERRERESWVNSHQLWIFPFYRISLQFFGWLRSRTHLYYWLPSWWECGFRIKLNMGYILGHVRKLDKISSVRSTPSVVGTRLKATLPPAGHILLISHKLNFKWWPLILPSVLNRILQFLCNSEDNTIQNASRWAKLEIYIYFRFHTHRNFVKKVQYSVLFVGHTKDIYNKNQTRICDLLMHFFYTIVLPKQGCNG